VTFKIFVRLKIIFATVNAMKYREVDVFAVRFQLTLGSEENPAVVAFEDLYVCMTVLGVFLSS